MNIIKTIPEKEKREITALVDSLIAKFTNEVELWKKAIINYFTVNNLDEQTYHTVGVFMRIRLSMLDMTILLKQVFKAENEVEQNLYARLLCGQLFEFTGDVPEMFGKDFRNILSHSPQHEVLMNELNRLMKEFHSKRVKFSNVIRDVRHNVSSHKDSDGLKQIYLIQELDFHTIIYAFLEINNWYCELRGFEIKLSEIEDIDLPTM